MRETNQIAILLASCNGEKYKAEQVESLLAQTETGWELFIHDDGSKDRTPEILRRFEARHPDRIHVPDGPQRGGAKDNFLRMMRDVREPYCFRRTEFACKMFARIIMWDERNDDVNTNTIDRALESLELRAVCTNPFLVGHKEN